MFSSQHTAATGCGKSCTPKFPYSVWPNHCFNLYPVQSVPTTSYDHSFPMHPSHTTCSHRMDQTSSSLTPLLFLTCSSSSPALLSLLSSGKIHRTADAAKQAAQWLCCTPTVHTVRVYSRCQLLTDFH